MKQQLGKRIESLLELGCTVADISRATGINRYRLQIIANGAVGSERRQNAKFTLEEFAALEVGVTELETLISMAGDAANG